MAEAKTVSVGDYIDYTPSGDIAAGQVVVVGGTAGTFMASLVGIATRAIQANALGALAVNGIFDVAKASGAINAGAVLYWDDTNNVATTTSTGNYYIGKAVKAAAAADSTVRILLNR